MRCTGLLRSNGDDMAFSTDDDLEAIVPDIFDLGIPAFTAEHAKAQADIEREIRNRWWHRKGIQGEMNASYLTESQWTRASAYLVSSCATKARFPEPPPLRPTTIAPFLTRSASPIALEITRPALRW